MDELENIVIATFAFSVVEVVMFLVLIPYGLYGFLRSTRLSFARNVLIMIVLISFLQIAMGVVSMLVYIFQISDDVLIASARLASFFLAEKFINNLSLLAQCGLIALLCHRWTSIAHKMEGKYYEDTAKYLKAIRNIYLSLVSTLFMFEFIVGLIQLFIEEPSSVSEQVSCSCPGNSFLTISNKQRRSLNFSSSFNILNNLILIGSATVKFGCGRKLQTTLNHVTVLTDVEFKTWRFKAIYLGAFSLIIFRCLVELGRQGYELYLINADRCVCTSTIYGFLLYYILYQLIEFFPLALSFGAVNPVPQQFSNKDIFMEFQNIFRQSGANGLLQKGARHSQFSSLSSQNTRHLQMRQIQPQVFYRPRVTEL